MKNIEKLFLTVFVGSIVACSGGQNSSTDMDSNPVVTVNGKTLYKADVDEVLPKGLSAEDSIAAAKKYIRIWIDGELMYAKAKQNITDQAQIDALVEDYRRSLIVNTYQEQLLKDELSKRVPDSELKNYYDQNPDKFPLEESIIKGIYLKVPLGSAQLKDFQKWYKQASDKAIENIEKNTLKGAVGYEYFYDRWLSFDDVMDNIPFAIDDSEQFLRGNKSYEQQDSSFVYMLNIKEYKLKGSPAPYDYIKTRLKDIFLEAKKNDFMKQVGTDLYEKAVADKEIKFYD